MTFELNIFLAEVKQNNVSVLKWDDLSDFLKSCITAVKAANKKMKKCKTKEENMLFCRFQNFVSQLC